METSYFVRNTFFSHEILKVSTWGGGHFHIKMGADDWTDTVSFRGKFIY